MVDAFEAPAARGADRGIGRHDPDPVVGRREIGLARPVALADLQELSGGIDAQAVERQPGPAVAAACVREPPFRAEHAVAAVGGEVTLEVGLVAEKAEAVLDFPGDAHLGVGRRHLRRCAVDRHRHKGGQQASNSSQTHRDLLDGVPFKRAMATK